MLWYCNLLYVTLTNLGIGNQVSGQLDNSKVSFAYGLF